MYVLWIICKRLQCGNNFSVPQTKSFQRTTTFYQSYSDWMTTKGLPLWQSPQCVRARVEMTQTAKWRHTVAILPPDVRSNRNRRSISDCSGVSPITENSEAAALRGLIETCTDIHLVLPRVVSTDEVKSFDAYRLRAWVGTSESFFFL